MTSEHISHIETISPNRSIIVVSDLHLGGKEDDGTSERFCRFLDGVRDDFTTDHDEKLLPPEKIILLGDILELWDSRCQDRNNVLLDSLKPFHKLMNLGCEIIYIVGNHDEDITELIKCADNRVYSEKNITTTMKKSDNPSEPMAEVCVENIHICIVKNKITLMAGGVRYSLLHGHQFDPGQIFQRLGKFLKQRCDLIDFFQDVANISVVKQLPIAFNECLFAGCILLILYLVRIHPDIPLAGWVILVIIIWSGLLVSLSRVITFHQRSIYNLTKFQDEDLGNALQKLDPRKKNERKDLIRRFQTLSQEKIKDLGSMQNFKPEKCDADIVVYGHTHEARFTQYTVSHLSDKDKRSTAEKNLFLLNTGSWVNETNPATDKEFSIFRWIGGKIKRDTSNQRTKQYENPYKLQDTFVYIDNTKSGFLTWEDHEDKGEKGKIRRKVALKSNETILNITQPQRFQGA